MAQVIKKATRQEFLKKSFPKDFLTAVLPRAIW